MKPYVICQMNSSVDGRILSGRWRLNENGMGGVRAPACDIFDRQEDIPRSQWLAANLRALTSVITFPVRT